MCKYIYVNTYIYIYLHIYIYISWRCVNIYIYTYMYKFVCEKSETCHNKVPVVPSVFSEKSAELFSHM